LLAVDEENYYLSRSTLKKGFNGKSVEAGVVRPSAITDTGLD
jgi:hypothetical protein